MSQMTETTSEPFVKREVLEVLDQQGGSYNGKITWETSSISNSGKWCSLQESWLEIPFVISWKNSVDISGVVNPAMVGMKNGFHQLIDSIQVDYQNRNVVQLTSYSNLWINYKLLTTWSQDDVAKYGATLNFFPDTSTSFNYSAAVSANGNGVSNNVIYPLTAISFATAGMKYATHNEGLLKRIRNLGYDTDTACMGGCSAFYTSPSTTGMSYYNNDGAGTAAEISYIKLLATIPLKFVHDFFDKMPLVKGCMLKITMNYNSSYQVIACVNQTSLGYTAGSVSILTGTTNPLLITSAAANNPNYSQATGNLTVACGVCKTNTPSITHDKTVCTLHVPVYTMNPTFEDQYLSLHPTKEVIYNDIYNFNIFGKTAGGSLQTSLTNAITNPKTLLVVPVLNGSTAGNNATVTGITPITSPFASEPGTTSPLLAISEFNVQVSGQNMFPANFKYDFDAFLTYHSLLNQHLSMCYCTLWTHSHFCILLLETVVCHT